MSPNSFIPLASFRLPSPSRLVANSCCPEKDLVVLFSRLGGTDIMSLWNISQGSRIWEVGVSEGSVNNSQATGVAWSPDGQSIAVICDPTSIALHSLQDGHITLSLTLPMLLDSEQGSIHFTEVWWFREEGKEARNSSIPDIFKRNEIITGSALSFLRLLPLLDNLQEEPDKLTATDLFAFQGSHTRLSHKSELPKSIARWPTLATDLPAASISNSSPKTPSDRASINETDISNVNSVLMIADDSGRLLCYLDGTFPLGFIPSGSKTDIISLVKHPSRPLFVGHSRTLGANPRTFLNLTAIDIPLLSQRITRDFAKLSSASRELIWYSMRVVKDMREAWYGSESISGARELGPKWVRSLEEKQKEQFGQEDPTPILDLTCLLTTGRATESLTDFLGSSEQMSERGIQKWEITVSDALIKLRDSSEKRIAPALQRLILILDELHGWAKLPQFRLFELQMDQVTQCIDLASRGIVVTSWLAALVRRELLRFREFMTWLRYEVNNINSPNEGHVARHDLLEVNNYLIDGLESSHVDKWFVGPVPQFQPNDMGVPSYGDVTLKGILQGARSHANNSSEMSWQKGSTQNNLEKLDRNVDALIHELANRCELVFSQASVASSRSAVVSFHDSPNAERMQEHVLDQTLTLLFRERTIMNETGELVQHLIARISSSDENAIFLAQLRYKAVASSSPSEISIVPIECYFADESLRQTHFDILDSDFFDDESVVIIGRHRQGERQAFIATFKYNNIGYQSLQSDGDVRAPTREDLIHNGWALWKKGHLSATRVPINRRRVLSGCKRGGVSLALNGRVGRRVACVLDSAGITLESFDLEGDGEETEVADDTRTG
ncbi:anaphase-promoting complex, cyclosome, subunit 4-domain-containing protein [Gymnopilus junonius]|uniref:Anaphase-promoting complex subunit 4 n=1 Tax=Gymnopilus junonius TaxID=109634 RepID=A0A9P5TEX3_GYMJU|nr:anaphase-promoting complex, cyclosome, subunit 4-domain-containing protein [Gymnopilus junonius]